MIQKYVDIFMVSRDKLREDIRDKEVGDYQDLVTRVIKTINPDLDYGAPCWEKVHEIDDGDYQGTLLYIIPNCGYQPSTYWAVAVDYGSCSGCDTLEGIRSEDDLEERLNQYMTLALHIIQGLKNITDSE